jgi:hypothetical protein
MPIIATKNILHVGEQSVHVDQESLQTTGKEIFQPHANLYELGHDNVHCQNAGLSENSINIKNEYMAHTQYATVSTPSRIEML